VAHNIQFKKTMSTFSLTMTGITTMVGSGWLLATQKIANVAGPSGIVAWGIGMLVALLIAIFCIEIGTAHPSAGGIGYYSSITHGRFSGFMTQWINWLSILPVPAVEAQAIVQYLSESNSIYYSWYNPHLHVLTHTGIIYAVILMAFFMVINYFGLKLFIRFNNILTILKIIVPVLTIICLVYAGFHPTNFGHNIHEFVPNGWLSIGSAVISCGVVMSFNGFQSPLNFSEEIPNPRKQLPIAIISAILFTFFLYVMLQAVFIGSLNPAKIANGWSTISFRSPYVNLLLIANLQVMAWVVMASAAISPAACGATFLASSSRILYILSRSKMLPQYLNNLDTTYNSPRRSIVINMLIGCMFLFLFRGWSSLVAVISILHVFSYLSMPIVVLAYRKIKTNNEDRVFRLPFAPIMALLVLLILSLLLFFAAWPSIGHLAMLCIPGLCFFFYYESKNLEYNSTIWQTVKDGSWIIFYLAGISLLCYLGNNHNSMHQIINLHTSMLLLTLLSLFSLYYGVTSAENYIKRQITAPKSEINPEMVN
jgi:amino acid transporter